MSQRSGNPISCDIAISGGGAVGLVSALAFAQAGFRVGLIAPVSPVADGRTVALLSASWDMLGELGLREALTPLATPMSTMRLVDDTGSLFRTPPVTFRAGEAGLEAFGWNIPLAALIAALDEAVDARPVIRRISGKTTMVSHAHEAVELQTDAGITVTAPVLVAAEGRISISRDTSGITAKNWTYPQVALTAMLSHPKRDHDDTSTEFHTRSGPCTLVPLAGRRSSLVWMVAETDAAHLNALSNDAFARAVERHVHSILGAFSVDGGRGHIPMAGLGVGQYAARRIMLVGESAHVFPPLGAQGLNLGLRDVAAAVEQVSRAHAEGDDLGADTVMAAYGAQRRTDVELRTLAVDGLNRSLLTRFLPLDFARGAGLLGLAHIGPLRRLVMRAGLAGGDARSGT
jgi:2-octaprenyl-6-methoxyphenol hydroxylase